MNSPLSSRHPILLQEYAVYTPPIEEMITTIGDWIDQRLTGGYIYGPSRFGKTKAVKFFVRMELEKRFGCKLPLVVWVRRDSQMREAEFWNLLLLASDFHFASPFKPKTKLQGRFLFKERLVTLARKSKQNYIVLIIDEAHEVTLNEWKWILGLQNELDNEGYRLSVFSIGSHGLGYQPDYLARVGSPHIAARFFAADARYYGIRDYEELGYVLNGYDEDSDWPPGSGISYLRYFSPSDYDAQNRLFKHSVRIWNLFIELCPSRKIFRKNRKEEVREIPMLHIALVVEQILRLLSKGAIWEEVMERDSLLKMIANTGFSDHMRRIEDA